MKTKAVSLIILSTAIIAVPVMASAGADSTHAREREIKAAFTYNFMKFVTWPPERMEDANEPVTVGLIGSKDSIEILKPITRKSINKKKIVLKYFAGYEKLKKSQEADGGQWNQKIEALKDCHVLLFCICYDSARIENSGEILKALRDSPILTIGDTKDFLKSGGMIHFVMEDNKVHFEINAAAAKKSKLKISSNLLRLAKRVIEEESPQ